MDPVVLDAGGRGTEQLLKRGHQSTRESRGTAPLRCEDRWCRRLGWSQVRPAGPLLPAQPHSDTRARPAAATRDPEKGSSPSVSLQNSLPWKPPHSENGGGSRPLCSPAALRAPRNSSHECGLEELRPRSREDGLGSNGWKRGLPRRHTLSPVRSCPLVGSESRNLRTGPRAGVGDGNRRDERPDPAESPWGAQAAPAVDPGSVEGCPCPGSAPAPGGLVVQEEPPQCRRLRARGSPNTLRQR